jgi:hypothetical protein
VPVQRRPGSGAIPYDSVVISANGRAAEELNRIWDAWHSDGDAPHLLLHTGLSYPARLSVGGHPILLRDGVRQHLDPADGMVTGRHPRTLLAATHAGEVLLVTIDGRRPGHSIGATLAEATDLLLELGAFNAINLDGGGSTTFALDCEQGACVVNRPSDGTERPVPLALAVVSTAPPPPPPPPPPPVTAASAAGPAVPEAVAAPVATPPPEAAPAPAADAAPAAPAETGPPVMPEPVTPAPALGPTAPTAPTPPNDGPESAVVLAAARPADPAQVDLIVSGGPEDDVRGIAPAAATVLAAGVALAIYRLRPTTGARRRSAS